jgi:hypothetical protein
MSATQHEAFRRFVEMFLSRDDPYASIFRDKTLEEALDEATAVIEPFLLNPERHRTHIRLIVQGLYSSAQLQIFDRQLGAMLKMARKIRPDLSSAVRRYYQNYIDELREAQSALYRNIQAGEIKLDLLPVKYVSFPESEQHGDFRLIGMQLNVAVQPSNGINAQSLSVKIEADNERFQFSDATPSTRVESIGSHELGISDTGRFIRSEKESEKVVAKMSVSGLGADAELAEEKNSGVELSKSKEAKITRLDVEPAVISAAVGNTVHWDFLRTRSQPLIGGFRLAATAFIPKQLKAINFFISALVQFEGWGPQHRTIQSEVVLPPEGAPPVPS